MGFVVLGGGFTESSPSNVSDCNRAFCSCFRWDFCGEKNLKSKNRKQMSQALSSRPVQKMEIKQQ